MRFMIVFNFVSCFQSLYDDKEIVEIVGYVFRQKIIENLLFCGQRFIEFRMEEFDGKSVEEVLENVFISCVNNLDFGEFFNLFVKLFDEVRVSKVNVGSGIFLQVEEKEFEVGKIFDLSKEG